MEDPKETQRIFFPIKTSHRSEFYLGDGWVVTQKPLWNSDTLIYVELKSRCVCVCVHAKSCPTLYDPMPCSPPGSSVHGILQARTLEWGASPFLQGILPTQGSSPGLQHHRQILYHLSHQEGLKEPMPSWYVRLLFSSGTVFSTCWFTPNSLPETEWDGLEEFHTLIDLSTPLPLTAEQKVGFNPQWLVRSLGSGCCRFGVQSCFSHPSRWPDTCLPPHLSGRAQDSTSLTGKLWPEWFRPQEAL